MSSRTSSYVLVFVALLIFGLFHLFFYEPSYHGLADRDPAGVSVIAHRGLGNLGPDNALISARIALEQGLDGVDVDGQMTADGQLVIFHDPTVDSLTDGHGAVRDKTLAELRKLDLGYRFDERFRGEPISSFEDFIMEIDGLAILMVELKESSVSSQGSAEEAVRIIQKHDAHSFVYLSSFNPFVLYRIKKLDPHVRTIFIFMDQNVDQKELQEKHPTDLKGIPFFLRKEPFRRVIRKIIKPDFLSIHLSVDQRTVKVLSDKGWPFFLWPPDSEEDIREALAKDPRALITNEPFIAQQLRDAL